MFHVSQLWRYVKDDSHTVDHSELELRPDLSLFGGKIVVKTLFSIDFQKEGDYKNLLQKRKRSLLITLPFFNCWVLLGVGEGESCLP